jgi:quinolinate synthase
MQAIEIKPVEYEHPQDGASCVAHAWARTPATPSAEERVALKARIKRC